MKRIWWLIGLACVIGVGCSKPAAAGGDDAEGAKAPVSVEMAEVTAKTIRATVTLQGSFVPAQGTTAKLAASAPGRVAQVLVHEGDSVTPGQLLAVIDNRVQKAQSQSAQLGARSADAQARTAHLTAEAAKKDQQLSVQTAQLALDSAKAEAASERTQREVDLRTAEADLSKLNEGARPQERAQAHQAVVQAEITQRRAAQELRRSQTLAAEGFISKRDLADAQAANANAISGLESARQAESLVLAGARPQERAAAELRVKGAKDAFESAIKVGVQKVALAEASLRQAKQSLLTVQAREADAVASIAAAGQKGADAVAARAGEALLEIRSPIGGRVTHRYLNPGDAADTTVPVLEVMGSGKVDFLGALPASDASAIKTGMKATIGDAEGQVISVSAGDPTTGLASVRIATSAKSTPGSYGTAVVITETHANVLSVPSDAVVQREGKQVLYVVDGDTAKQVEVEVGPEDAGFVEIDKGVTAGQKVVKLGQSELSDGAKVKPAAPKEADKVDDAKKDEGAAKDVPKADETGDGKASPPAEGDAKKAEKPSGGG
jgi:cobalt-zinc-cadmium efflux system membrane fusion protein